jgi:hypothetical protein
MPRLFRLLFFILIASSVALGASKLETIGPCSDASVPDAVRAALLPQGHRVTFDDGTAAEIWFRSQVPAAAKGDGIYSLPESALVAVIRFDKPARDYRGQSVAAGAYTLRYELQPNDGDHLGTAPTRDFLLAVPASADTDPNAAYKFDALVALSRKTTKSQHPSPWNLVAPEAKSFPSAVDDAEAHTVLTVKLKTDKGELPLALVVHGTAAQ